MSCPYSPRSREEPFSASRNWVSDKRASRKLTLLSTCSDAGWAYEDFHFKSAAATTTPKTKARTAYTASPKRSATNVVAKETIKPKKSTLHQAPLANECANSLSFSCFSFLLLARALSLLDTLLDDRLRTLMLTTLHGFGAKRPAPDGPWPVWQLRSAPYCRTDYVLHSPPSSNSIGERRVANRPIVGPGLK